MTDPATTQAIATVIGARKVSERRAKKAIEGVSPVSDSIDQDREKKQRLGRQALISTTPQGVLTPAITGRKKLTAF